tara:strand:- start:44 stop:358 length:315 start_codon:yes stop_codon:yes gene_type:complete
MNIKEGKYTHKVTLTHYRGKVVTRYTNDPETRGEVLLDHGYKPLEGQTELVFTRINDDPITPEASTMPEMAASMPAENLGSESDLDIFDESEVVSDESDEEVVA